MADNPFSALFGGSGRYNAQFDPEAGRGSLTGFLGGVMGAPTLQQSQGDATGRAVSAIGALRAQGKTPQEAAMSFFQSPEGQDFFANAGPDGMKRLAESIAATTTPPPTLSNVSPGGRLYSTNQQGKTSLVGDNPQTFAPTVLKPGDVAIDRQGKQMGQNTNTDPALEPAEVRTFKYFQSLANLPPAELAALAKIKLDPTQADKSTAATQAIDMMVTNYGLDPRTAEAMKAGQLQLIPLRDNLNIETGSFALVDKTNPQGGSIIINPKGNKSPNAAGVPSVQNPDGTPTAPAPGTTPDTGAGAGALPPAPPQTIPQRNPKYFGDKSSMFLGSGIVASALEGASNIGEQINPGMVLPEGAKAADRGNLINILRNSLSAMGQLGEGISVNKGTVESYLKLAPTGSAGETPHAAIQKGIRLHEKVTEEIQAEEATFNNPQMTPELRKAALKRADGWKRVLRALPTYDELSRMEEDIREGKAGAPTVAQGAKEIAGAASKALTETKKQVKEVDEQVLGNEKAQDFSAMTTQQLLAIDPRTVKGRANKINLTREIEKRMKRSDLGGTQIAEASVTPLHPPGTFSRNTQGGDVINGVARQLGIGPPSNVVQFPRRS